MRTICFVALLLASTHSASIACSPAFPAAVLPGLTDEQVSERVDRLNSDWKLISRHSRVERLLSEASTIYIARIIKKQGEVERFPKGGARISPLHALKGALPPAQKSLITLEGSGSAGCDRDLGDGEGTTSEIGELIIVFEGLSKEHYKPNGIDSVKISDLRNVDLLIKIEDWLKTQPGYKAYD